MTTTIVSRRRISPLARFYRRNHARLESILFAVLAGAFVVFALAPFLWLAICSLKTPQTLYRNPPTLFPNPVFIDHYIMAFKGRPFAWNILNSAIVAAGSMLVALAIGVPYLLKRPKRSRA